MTLLLSSFCNNLDALLDNFPVLVKAPSCYYWRGLISCKSPVVGHSLEGFFLSLIPSLYLDFIYWKWYNLQIHFVFHVCIHLICLRFFYFIFFTSFPATLFFASASYQTVALLPQQFSHSPVCVRLSVCFFFPVTFLCQVWQMAGREETFIPCGELN